MARTQVTTITKTSTSEVVLNYLTPVNGTPAAGQFRSSITGRAKMVDLASDMLPRMGVERIIVQSIIRLDGETGPNGECVYKPVNDRFDQIRYVGYISNRNQNNSNGTYNQVSASTTDFIEVSFYGTGLNALVFSGSSTYSAAVSINGGAETTWYPANASVSGILSGRNYSINNVMNVVSGLTLGFYTAKIRSTDATNGVPFYGFEILNESTSIQVGAGQVVANGVARTIAASSTAYNSGFESGTLGTRGGRVLVYAKRDGTIGKAVTPVNASSLTLASADHSNEEVIRNYFFREFGAGRSDDFSTLTTISNRAFTLDDGTTTLSGSSVTASINQYQTEGESLRMNTGEAIMLTFVGTGLDAFFVANAIARDVDVSIDGASNINLTIASNFIGIKKIVSGLPYGTHTVRFAQTSGNNPGFQNFIVYGPKKPILPTGAIELGEYNILGNFSAFSSSTNASINTHGISQGVIRKANTREFVYTGAGWSVAAIDYSSASTWRIQTTTTSNYVEYTFFGTGFDMRYFLASNNATSATISVDGVTNLSGAGYTTGVYGGTSFTASTGVLNQSTGAGVGSGGAWVSGIPLGVHKVRVTYTSGGAALRVDAFDIITPIHTHKDNGSFIVQNTLAVGSQGINDLRLLPKLNNSSPSCVAKNVGTGSVTSTTLVPMLDMQTSFYLPVDSTVDVGFMGAWYNATTYVHAAVFLNGIQQHDSYYQMNNIGDSLYNIEFKGVLSKGWHHVKIMCKVSGGSGPLGTAEDGRIMNVTSTPLKS